ncbi:rhodanese-like domain-containing protein [Brevundimonas sp.]|uniref:rhodanese-like domain-containing protein n=1 Tax=Brevundimonas sp. TaxID=1871086 RepID=UPI0017B9BBD2|nr:rhodanese-like domain-containing protein [Brevundimonas sp.]MBA4806954.1 rhodanese-like domain-containing protein [Brevundimonas sp.]
MTVATVSVEEAAAWLQSGEAVLVDVREPDEFAAARIDGAILAPLSQMPAAWEALDLPADRKVVVMCLRGGRSHQVCAFVGPAGPEGQPLFNLTGGIQAWHVAGLPIIEDAD